MLNEQAHVALSTHILTELMTKVPGSLPKATLCLIRLFFAVTVSPITSTARKRYGIGSCTADVPPHKGSYDYGDGATKVLVPILMFRSLSGTAERH